MRKLVVAAVVCFGLFAVVARGQDEAPPPSPKEVSQALQEHKDAIAALRTAERALAASSKKLETLLKRLPTTAPGVYHPAPAPAVAFSVPLNTYSDRPIPAQPSIPVPAAPVNLPTAPGEPDALKEILSRLERMESRLADLEKSQAPKR